jgi:hypothetical protein
MPPPALDQISGLSQRVEQLAVEEFITQLAVERFVVAILDRSAGPDEI